MFPFDTISQIYLATTVFGWGFIIVSFFMGGFGDNQDGDDAGNSHLHGLDHGHMHGGDHGHVHGIEPGHVAGHSHAAARRKDTTMAVAPIMLTDKTTATMHAREPMSWLPHSGPQRTSV
ncbi:MAG: hypothetical protein IPJ49_13710 [Candidatus Obscuribacter sp.]|nr:hypothetical protein [Candidatus Obscuribacter sp.]